jgi:DNA-binding CsgD family transcriptional regulator
MDWSAIPERAKQHLTRRQQVLLDILAEGKPVRQAAKEMQLDDRSAWYLKARTLKALAAAGYTETFDATRFVDPGQQIKGKSTLTKDDEGNTVWVKTDLKQEQKQEHLASFARALCDEISRAKPAPLPKIKHHDPDMMTGIFIGDAHIGMRAFGKETKHHDFDTDIATQQLRDAADYLIAKAEPTETGLLVDVGDYMHANGHNNATFAGTPLDVDTRHRSTMYEAAMAMRYFVDKMLAKFKKVVVVVARGNHNDDVAPAIELMLSFYYEKEPRVTILPTHGYYHYIEYGNWLLGITHGDKQKAEALAGSMARDMSQAWGRTTHRLWCTGHYHKEAVKTLPGVKHKVFAALPPPDAWHSSHGFSGDGELEMLTFRKSGGLYSSHVYNIPRPIIQPDVTI